MTFVLREFRPGDFETLWAIDQACFAPGIAYSRQELRTYIGRKNAFTLIAEREDEISPQELQASPCAKVTPGTVAGFIVAEHSRGKGHIITIDVLAEARRSGVGSQLLNSAEDRLRSKACKQVFLETAVDNQAAISFYKRHRYFILGTEPRYYSNGVDALVLGKEL